MNFRRKKPSNPKILAGIYAEAALSGKLRQCREVTKVINSDDNFAQFFVNLTLILSEFGRFLDDIGVRDVDRFFYEIKTVGNNDDLI